MTAPVTYMIERVVIAVDTGAYDCVIKGQGNCRLDPGLQEAIESGSSELDWPTARATTGQFPVITGDTLDCGTLLAAVFANLNVIPHIPIVTSGGAVGVDIYLQATASGSALRGGAGTNIKIRIKKGVLVPVSLSGDPARLTYQIVADWDGTNAPITITTGQNLPAGSAGATALWKAASIKDNTTVLSQLAGWSLDFNVGHAGNRASNSIYQSGSGVYTFAPTARFSSTDLAVMLAACGFAGKNAGTAGLIFYLAQYDADGVGVGAADAIAFTFRATVSYYYPVSTRLGQYPVSTEFAAVAIGGTAAQPPMTYGAGATLPTEAAGANLFCPGGIYDNATEVEIHGGDIAWGIAVGIERNPALMWPDRCVVLHRQPELRIQTPDTLYHVGLSQGREIATAWNVWFRKMVSQSVQAGDASLVHVGVSIPEGRIAPQEVGGAHGQIVPGSVRILPRKGAAAILTISTGVAIT